MSGEDQSITTNILHIYRHIWSRLWSIYDKKRFTTERSSNLFHIINSTRHIWNLTASHHFYLFGIFLMKIFKINLKIACQPKEFNSKPKMFGKCHPWENIRMMVPNTYQHSISFSKETWICKTLRQQIDRSSRIRSINNLFRQTMNKLCNQLFTLIIMKLWSFRKCIEPSMNIRIFIFNKLRNTMDNLSWFLGSSSIIKIGNFWMLYQKGKIFFIHTNMAKVKSFITSLA